jgi:hypothetical protein
MLGLVRQTLRPLLPLRRSVKHWHVISCLLREPPRKRELQIERITKKRPFLF